MKVLTVRVMPDPNDAEIELQPESEIDVDDAIAHRMVFQGAARYLDGESAPTHAPVIPEPDAAPRAPRKPRAPRTPKTPAPTPDASVAGEKQE